MKIRLPLMILSLIGLAACSSPAAETVNNLVSEATELVATVSPTAAPPHWDYEEEGPSHWANLPGYELCGSGRAQSPIDLSGETTTNLVNINFDYGETAVNVHNNGHTVEVKYDEGDRQNNTITINEITYYLHQFHFHAPSEHMVDGVQADAEMHLVHKTLDEKYLAVVGVLIFAGAENEAFNNVWEYLPESIPADTSINAANLLPADRSVYRYTGSLTTPPCSEGVLWSVMHSPVEMSEDQIGKFIEIFEGVHTNRPVQPLNNRDLQLDETP